jgi:hypothetical protein
MPKPKIKYDVVLNEEGIKQLADFSFLLRDGSYFNCDNVHHEMHYLHLFLDIEFGGDIFPMELAIPYHYVRYILSAHPRKTESVGFATPRDLIKKDKP